MSLVYHFWNTV